MFGTACTPETPIGTCMVSSEGACAAYYNFGRLHREAAVTLGRPRLTFAFAIPSRHHGFTPLLQAILDTSDDAIFGLDPEARDHELEPQRRTTFRVRRCRSARGQPSRSLFPRTCRTTPRRCARPPPRATSSATSTSRSSATAACRCPSRCRCARVGRDHDETVAVAIARDITEQRARAGDARRDRPLRIRESEALAHVGSWLWDVRTNTVQWSDEMHRMIGIDPLSFDGTLAGHVAPILCRRPGRCARGAADRGRDGPWIRGGISHRPPRWRPAVGLPRAAAAVGSDGAVVGFRGISQDVTDRH